MKSGFKNDLKADLGIKGAGKKQPRLFPCEGRKRGLLVRHGTCIESPGCRLPAAQLCYDRFGEGQDTQGIYENPALDDLVARADLPNARSVF